jgi:chemotaxis protein methyltransferase CheR
MNGIGSLARAGDRAELAQAVVDTIRSPLLVLDKDLRVVAANRFFRASFDMSPQAILGRAIYVLDDGRWNIPELRSLLEKVLTSYAPMEAHDIEHNIAGRDQCTMLFNARSMFYEHNADQLILLAMKDVTEERACELEVRKLLQRKDVLLQEMQHRIGNSLQIIASVLLLKARTVRSEETRQHLEDVHGRVVSIFAAQRQLQASQIGERVDLGVYLSRLCESLAASMIGDTRPISLKVSAANISISANEAVSIGLIVTELVINALKYAFGPDRTDGLISVAYEVDEGGWRLSVFDNGGGKSAGAATRPGLGTSIIESLAHQLDSRVDVVSDSRGYKTAITYGVWENRDRGEYIRSHLEAAGSRRRK